MHKISVSCTKELMTLKDILVAWIAPIHTKIDKRLAGSFKDKEGKQLIVVKFISDYKCFF